MSAMTPRKPRRDAARNHQLVIDAARELLGEAGLDASMEQIAARAGVGIGTVYRRFPGKESLVEELVTLVTSELVSAGEEILADDDGTGLESFLRVLGRSFAQHRRWASLLLHELRRADCGAGVVRGQLAQLYDNAHRAGTVGPDVQFGDVLSLVWAMRGMVEASCAVAPDAWQRHLDIHLAGLRSPGRLSETPALTADELSRLPTKDTTTH